MMEFQKAFDLLSQKSCCFNSIWNLLEHNIHYFGDTYYAGNRDGSRDVCDFTWSKYLNDLLYKDNGIKELLDDMVCNPDKRFINEVESNVLENVDYLIQNDKFYMFNFYVIMKAYQYNKDDFENFKAIVKDVASLVDVNVSVFCDYRQRLKYLEKIVQYKFYKDVPGFKELIKELFCYFKYNYDDKDCLIYSDIFNTIDDCIKDNEKFKLERIDTNFLNVINGIIEISDDYRLYLRSCFLLDNIQSSIKYYFDTLLIGERFDYFFKKIYVIGNRNIRNQLVLGGFSELSCGLFRYLNDLGGKRDSFITCLDIIFDSDTYGEMKRKIDDLKMACKKYDTGEVEEAINIVKDLDSLNKKDREDGQIVMYPRECMNRIQKPKEIETRMRELYTKINPAYERMFTSDAYFVSSIEELYLNLTKEKNKVKKSYPFEKIKKILLDKRG